MTSVLEPPGRTAHRGLLSYGEQVRLARAMDTGREAERLLDEGRRLPAAERLRLEEEAERGEDARRTLVEAHAALVLTEAQRYAGRDRRTLVELVQRGNSGLVRAVDTFDWRRGVRLSSYASRWIRVAIESDRPDLPEPGAFRPDPVVLSLYRERVVSLDDGESAAPAPAPVRVRNLIDGERAALQQPGGHVRAVRDGVAAQVSPPG